MASGIFQDIFGVSRLWPPVFFRIFLECPGCGLLSFWGYFWSVPVVASGIFQVRSFVFWGTLEWWFVMFLGA